MDDVKVIGSYCVHELAGLFPAIPAGEYEELKEDINSVGQQQPVSIVDCPHEGEHVASILDGAHRARICDELGVEVKAEKLSNDISAKQYVISANLMRRHMSGSQRAMLASDLEGYEHGGDRVSAEAEQDALSQLARDEASDLAGVSGRHTARAAKVKKQGTEEIAQAVRDGDVTLNDAEPVVELPEDDQREALRRVREGEASNLRGAVSMMEREELKKNPPELPKDKYRVIVIDPPWPLDKVPTGAYDEDEDEGPLDYPTMTLNEIDEVPVWELAGDDCWLFLWTTNRFLPDAFTCVESWGFDYRFTMVWSKSTGMQIPGLPKSNLEFVIVASVGRPKFTDTKAFAMGFEGKSRKHSQKPEEFYELLRRVSPEPRIDMFGREKIEGFKSWGSDIKKMDGEANAG